MELALPGGVVPPLLQMDSEVVLEILAVKDVAAAAEDAGSGGGGGGGEGCESGRATNP